jgi:hypothetical protein
MGRAKMRAPDVFQFLTRLWRGLANLRQQIGGLPHFLKPVLLRLAAAIPAKARSAGVISASVPGSGTTGFPFETVAAYVT